MRRTPQVHHQPWPRARAHRRARRWRQRPTGVRGAQRARVPVCAAIAPGLRRAHGSAALHATRAVAQQLNAPLARVQPRTRGGRGTAACSGCDARISPRRDPRVRPEATCARDRALNTAHSIRVNRDRRALWRVQSGPRRVAGGAGAPRRRSRRCARRGRAHRRPPPSAPALSLSARAPTRHWASRALATAHRSTRASAPPRALRRRRPLLES